MSNIVDFGDVLRAAHPRVRPTAKDMWRCAVWLSAFDWQGMTMEPSDMLSAQSQACKAYLARHTDLQRKCTFRNRATSRNVEAEFDRLMDTVENRTVDAVVVPTITCFGPTYSEAAFYVEHVLLPAGVRFVDVSVGFDSQHGGAKRYLKRIYDGFESYVQAERELDRLREGRVAKNRVPYGYVFAPDSPGGVRIDEAVADAVRSIFKFAAQEEYTASSLLEQISNLNAPSPRERKLDLAGRKSDIWRQPIPWSMVAVRMMVKNPFYTGAYDPAFMATSMVATKPEVLGLPMLAGHHPALVTRELQEKAISSLEKNKGSMPKRPNGVKGGCYGKKIAEGHWLFE